MFDKKSSLSMKPCTVYEISHLNGRELCTTLVIL